MVSVCTCAVLQGIVKYLSAVTSRNWGSVHSSKGAAGDDHNPLSGAVENLRQSMRASKGKQLMELVEILGGKPISLKVSQTLGCEYLASSVVTAHLHFCRPKAALLGMHRLSHRSICGLVGPLSVCTQNPALSCPTV